ncbi:hypothetical protein C3942_10060 [Solimonas fluminis]|uniref:Uncharacterized protein n=1 Tax=Solimonas fluminis TaxID=2086571 RepID=A0A2S5THR7_9GAMM|nr:hypothetical protein [Solimonas fluminis]PPE74358.1 hypothetical protein C3942_10060 [Solimonas fluminis]
MPALTPLLASGRRPLWLDYGDYAGALLGGGAMPWLDVAGTIALQRKAQGLLRSDVLQLPVAAVAQAWVAAHPALREAMAAKRRAVVPLKTLLADEALRAHLVELARGLRACFAEAPLALACPSPRAWVAAAYRLAHGEETEAGEDETDSAAVYMADFLRSFGEAGIDVLLLQEGAQPPLPELYTPVLNVAAHYRWEAGLQGPAGLAASGLAFVIAPESASGRPLAPAYWGGAAAEDCPAQGFRYAAIPADAQPESVLKRLAELRA